MLERALPDEHPLLAQKPQPPRGKTNKPQGKTEMPDTIMDEEETRGRGLVHERLKAFISHDDSEMLRDEAGQTNQPPYVQRVSILVYFFKGLRF